MGAEEARAWRCSYVALALSAALGGLFASGAVTGSYAVTYVLSAAAAAGALTIAWQFVEPDDRAEPSVARAAPALHQLTPAMGRQQNRVLAWMCALFVVMYTLSHIPFIYIQPYLRAALAGVGSAELTPVLIGVVIAAMMGVSAASGGVVIALRERVGTRTMYRLALALQVAVIAEMAIVMHPAIDALSLLRMVPGASVRPFMMEAIQPRLESSFRATFLSSQSLIARLGFAGVLITLASPSDTAELDAATLADVLPACALVGTVLSGLLYVAWPRELDRPKHPADQAISEQITQRVSVAHTVPRTSSGGAPPVQAQKKPSQVQTPARVFKSVAVARQSAIY
ncbi:MAG: hypothetical protein AAFQ42_14360 [Pseudomonadota bacterium]